MCEICVYIYIYIYIVCNFPSSLKRNDHFCIGEMENVNLHYAYNMSPLHHS